MPLPFAQTFDAYHAHVYYTPHTIAQARALCEAAAREFDIEMGTMHEKPVGPHPEWSCRLVVPAKELEALVTWLDEHRNGLDVLVHGLSGDEIRDHTELVHWLGKPYPLDLTKLF
jgi:DOPA 4,5-dioxygenase